MLLELVVENYAVVERVRVRYHPGLNLLTGETGSGKSIVVDALGLLFGGRASADMVRAGAERSRISGIFDLPSDPSFRELLESAGIEAEEGELLLEREIFANGKSRVFINSRPATVTLLKELAPYLGDIHGQHDQQRLFLPAAQLDLVDTFGGCSALVNEVADVYQRWRSVQEELAELERTEQEKLRLADLWSFQRKEIESVNPREGEDAELETERRVLQNLTRLQESANLAYESLYESPESAVANLGAAIRRLEEVCRIDPSLGDVLETLKPAQIAINEAARSLATYIARLEADPERLEQVESRLASIDKLKRKYGATIGEILAFLDDVRRNLDALETAGERREALKQQEDALRAEYETAAQRLSERRREAAAKLAARVEEELAGLAMKGTAFCIAVNPAAPSARGSDHVEFLVSPNRGEEPKPLEKVASGGELSRMALALKTCTTLSGKPQDGCARTLVFDEVDAGIGGAAAERVGERLKSLARRDQVLCVTHLAQIAAFADHHYVVEKREVRGRTVAEIEELTGEARVHEISRMLSGRTTPEALRHAEQLIRK